jgi:L-methionine (R)-S-oxide reductase
MSNTLEFSWTDFLAQTVAEFGCSTGTLHRLDLADKHLKLVAHQGIPEALMPIIQSIPVGKGIAGVAAERLEPVEMCNRRRTPPAWPNPVPNKRRCKAHWRCR